MPDTHPQVPAPSQDPPPTIRVRGARVHNLQNVDVDIPRDRLVVITGPSGSGKSSLAFDTIYAESHRQFLESLSVYARQFLDPLERPDVDSIEGLPPAVCVDQHPGPANPRSVVATATEIHDYLSLLMARLGQVFCHQCGSAIHRRTPEQMSDWIMSLPEGTKAMLLAPLEMDCPPDDSSADQLGSLVQRARKAGFVRLRLDGQVYDIEQIPDSPTPQIVEAVVDRIVIRPTVQSRLAESLQLALEHGAGKIVVVLAEPAQNRVGPDARQPSESSPWQDYPLSALLACPKCNVRYEEIEPRSFSFSSPFGACPTCGGLGRRASEKVQENSQDEREHDLTDAALCDDCGGSRLRIEARNVRLLDRTFPEISAFSITEARRFFQKFASSPDTEPAEQAAIAQPLIAEIDRRLDYLEQVGLEYLTLSRSADTLSGGERQRVRLAAAVGLGLVGACYVLDEPSLGLHPRDTERLLAVLRRLQQQSNTVLVVEHDESLMRAADWMIDLGPGAGADGGKVTAVGTAEDLCKNEDSLTGRYLRTSPRAPEAMPACSHKRREVDWGHALLLEGASANNLQHVDVRFPLGTLVCVSGVSGSGKSSLINDTLAPAVAACLGGSSARPGPYKNLSGADQVNKVINIDQSPLGRTPRSNAATATGMFDQLRKVYAATREARRRGFAASRFSFNAKGGRCEACKGLGESKIEMNFLPDLIVPCRQCGGSRFNRQTLQVRFRDKSIADALAMTVAEAVDFWQNVEKMRRPLQCLQDVGLGYLPLGQPATTLSGGEAQRVKLAAQLALPHTGAALYILDEPTMGLHAHDVVRLLDILHRLIDKGNSAIVIEHHLDVLQSADWIIDLGPEGGAGGGCVVAQGPPEQIAGCPQSHTGQFLRELFNRSPNSSHKYV